MSTEFRLNLADLFYLFLATARPKVHLLDYGAGYVELLREYILSASPFLGIYVGMQTLFESSEELPGVPGSAS